MRAEGIDIFSPKSLSKHIVFIVSLSFSRFWSWLRIGFISRGAPGATIVLTTVVFLIASVSHEASAEQSIVRLDTLSTWQFQSSSGETFVENPVGISISDFVPLSKSCCKGLLRWSGSAPDLAKWIQTRPALWIPPVGGLTGLRINGANIAVGDYVSSSIGTVIAFPNGALLVDRLTIEILIDASRGPFTGLWKQSPTIGDQFDLEAKRAEDVLTQRWIPLAIAIGLAILALPFLWICSVSRRDLRAFGFFGFSSISWALFYFFLSGIPRDLSFAIGSAMHFPVRIIAGLGLFTLMLAYFPVPRRVTRLCFSLYGIGCMVSVAAGVLGASQFQGFSWAAVSLLSAVPFFYFRTSSRNLVTWFVFVLGLISFFGQLSDVVKLIGPNFLISYPLPYLNRFTFLPLLLTSLMQFSYQFTELLRARNDLREKLEDSQQKALLSSSSARLVELARKAAHDIRSPLTALNMLTSNLSRNASEDHADQPIKKSIKRINDIADTLLESAKANQNFNGDDGQQKELEKLNVEGLSSIIDEIIEEKRVMLGPDSLVRISSDVRTNGEAAVLISKIELARILSNLLNNSLGAIGSTGTVAASLRVYKKTVVIAISDDGRGMSADILSKLGQQDFSSGKTRFSSGSGIGVFSAMTYLKDLGGRLEFQSKVGIGTIVSVILPREDVRDH